MSKLEFTSKVLSEMSVEKLNEKFFLLKKELFNLRFQKALGELNKMSRFAEIRKNIARIKTEIRKKKENLMPKRILQGTVKSAKNNKTVSVEVERRFRHPLYKKIVRKSTKYAVHDVDNRCKIGDKVKIQECCPISKTKSWVIVTE